MFATTENAITTRMPQANNVSAFPAVLAAVAGGCENYKDINQALSNAGMSQAPSTTRLAAQALVSWGFLGLNTEDTAHRLFLSEKGEALLSSSAHDQATMMVSAINELPIMDDFRAMESDSSRFAALWGSDLADSTFNRRVSALSAWDKFTNASFAEQSKTISGTIATVSPHAMAVAAETRLRLQEELANAQTEQTCTSCFLVYSARAAACTNCD